MRLAKTRSKNNVIWLIVDELIKFEYFLLMADTWTLDQLARAYLEESFCPHMIPRYVISY